MTRIWSRWLSARPPSTTRERGAEEDTVRLDRSAEEDSVHHLQELYAVTAGLALTIGVERVLPAEGQGSARFSVGLLFFGFVATLVPFYHGALRHLDLTYVRPDRTPGRGSVLFFGDFLFLFVEACLLIAMGASVENPHRFVAVWVLLLILDVIWLMVFVSA